MSPARLSALDAAFLSLESEHAPMHVGWAALFGTMAMVSLNLGLLNLLPIPILDGGHITILAVEGLARRDFSMRVKERMLMAGFAVLMLLMVTVIFNDLRRVEWLSRLLSGRSTRALFGSEMSPRRLTECWPICARIPTCFR